MVTIRSIVAAVAGIALLVPSCLAHSTSRNPLNRITFVQDADIHTHSRRLNAHSNFDLTFTLQDNGRKIRLVLEPNWDLIHHQATFSILGAHGKVEKTQPLNRLDHKVYKGSAYMQHKGLDDDWSHVGGARIVIHQDGEDPSFEGSFMINRDTHHIQLGKYYQKLRYQEDPMIYDRDVMVVWRDSDIRQPAWSSGGELKRDIADESLCNADKLSYNQYDLRTRHSGHGHLESLNIRQLFGRSSIDDGGSGNDANGVNLYNTIGSTSGCPSTRKVALVGIATDCNYWDDSFDTEEDVRKNILSIVNQASEVYEKTFRVSLGVGNITVSRKECPGTASETAPWNVACSNSVDLGDRLSLFSKWRGEFEDKNAYWTLLTTCGTQNAVGLAWRSQLCRRDASQNGDGSNETIAATNVVVKTPTEWQVFAHESGHTFGAVHDCTPDACPVDQTSQACCPLSRSTCDAGGRFIMNPATGPDISEFSPCSIGEICSGLRGRVDGDCLVDNQDVNTFMGGQCGNGIVEEGEDCDCGADDTCRSNGCCDADTCKFRNGAVCDPTNEDCCTDQCRFASSGTVCRASTGECDLEEKCSGTNSTCPVDSHKDDGDSCGNDGDGLTCASGQCTSRDLQCRTLVGGLGNSSDTRACPDSDSCLLSCRSSDFGSNTCVTYTQDFVDGTPCGAGGHCRAGSCEGTSTWGEIQNWIDSHKAIFIPVVTIVGLLVLIGLYSCIASCIKTKRRARRAPKGPDMQTWQAQYVNSFGPPPPPAHQPPGYQGPIMSGAHSNIQPPPVPPPEYSYSQNGQDPWFGRQRSTRYA